MKRKSILVLMLISAIMFTVFPASAQDETPIPPSCTSQEIADSVANVQTLSEKISAASTLGTNAKTGNELSASLIAWGEVYQSYLDEVYANFPSCIEGLFLGDVLGLVLNGQLTLSSMALLNVEQIAAGDTDEELTATMVDLATISSEVQQNTAGSFSSLMTQLGAGTAFPSWLPACTDEQNEFIATLDEFEATYVDQVDELQTYLEDGTVTKTTYITLAKLVSDLTGELQKGNGGCADLYGRTISDIFVFNDTIAALNVGLALTYRTESDDAEALTNLRDQFNERLASYVSSEE